MKANIKYCVLATDGNGCIAFGDFADDDDDEDTDERTDFWDMLGIDNACLS